jgi:acetyl-CoA carboxylase beta subunit
MAGSKTGLNNPSVESVLKTLQKPARTTDPIDTLIRKAYDKRVAQGQDSLEAQHAIVRTTGLTLHRVDLALRSLDYPT